MLIGPRRADRRDRVLEDHVIGAGVLDDHGEAIEVLDAPLELGAVHQADVHRQLLAPRVVQEHVLDVRLRSDGRDSRVWAIAANLPGFERAHDVVIGLVTLARAVKPE